MPEGRIDESYMRHKTTARSTHFATAGGVVAILLWSTTVALMRNLSEQLGPVTAAAGVYTVGGAAALVSLLRCSRRRQQILHLPVKYLMGCGVLCVGTMLFLFLAVGWAGNRQQVLEVGLINYLWPTLTLLLSLVLLGERANWMMLPGTLLALVGIFLVVTQGNAVSWQSFFGNLTANPGVYLLAFAAAVFWALYSNLTRKWAGGRNEGAMALFLPITALVFLLICCFSNEPREWNRRSLVELVFFGMATYFAYALWDNAMRRGIVVVVVAGSYLMPFLSTLASCFYLAIIPGGRLWVGCGVLVLGSILSWRSITCYTSENSQNQPLQEKAHGCT